MQKINLLTNRAQSFLLIGKIEISTLKDIFEVSNQDILYIFDDYNIAKMKELIHFVNLRPYNSTKRLVVVKDVDKLNSESANAILKTLEEPPEDVMIVLTTLNEQKILPTIVSRCQKVRLNVDVDDNIPSDYLDPEKLSKLSVSEKFKWVEKIAEGENIEQIIVLWQVHFRQKLLLGEDVLSILRQLSSAKDLQQRNISLKLLLENILLSF